ncbi:MAG: M56 family metallopeptidase [Oscillospiraceae bacterium]|nr:M56 family metallopeptidase [Oscillospiraceae bacterium]
MNSVLITILSLSASGSILALILFAGKPPLKNRVSKAFSYYIWLLVLLRLVIPLAAPGNVTNTLIHIWQPNTQVAGQTDVPSAAEQAGRNPGNPLTAQTASPQAPKNEMAASQIPSGAGHSVSVWTLIGENALWIWLSGAIISFGWFVTAYACFTRRIRRSCGTPQQEDLAVFREMSGGHRIRLACSSIVTTPALLGVIRPVIILPQFAYVHNAMENELRSILRHELTHYKKKDVLYKWLVVAVTSLHWFNPMMPLIRREIGKACELACDETVISKLSASEKKQYGNTLLAFSAAKKFPAGILATTLSEGKTELKERLVNIMSYKKKSTGVIVLTLVLTVLLTGCAIGLGAAKETPSSSQPMSSGSPDNGGSSTQQSILAQIDAALDTKVPLVLPSSLPVTENRFLTATTVSQATDYKVNFYETDQAAKINSQTASGGTLIASLEGTEYQDAESAKENISGYETVDLSSVDSDAIVDLGHQIKGTWDSGLGHQVLVWNEGRWCLRVDSPTDSTYQSKTYPDNEQLAKDVVAYLEDNMLPAPQEIGVIAINIWAQNQGTTIEWQDQQTVYQISSPDPMTALKVAVAMESVNQKT